MPGISFFPADRDTFRSKYRQFASLLDRQDFELWEVLNTQTAFASMCHATVDSDLPAVAGITKLVAPILQQIDDSEEDHVKKGIGAMTCLIMETNGFEKTNTKRAVPPVPYRIFSRGEMYREVGKPSLAKTPGGFDWDRFAHSASFGQVSRLSPELSDRPLPSMYAPDRSLYYVSSLDVDVPADEPLALQPLLRLVKQSYAKELASTPCNQRKLSTARVDFFELCRLLGECSDDPEAYSDPDRLLESEPENETVD